METKVEKVFNKVILDINPDSNVWFSLSRKKHELSRIASEVSWVHPPNEKFSPRIVGGK